MNVIPKVGQVWTCSVIGGDVDRVISAITDNDDMYDGIHFKCGNHMSEREIRLGNMTFKPANDLEWLAVNVGKWKGDSNYPYLYKLCKGGINYNIGSKDYNGFTRKQWQDKRDELFGFTEGLEVKMNNNIKIYPVNAGIVRANLDKMKELGAQLVESGVKVNIDDIAKEDGVTLKPVYTQAMSDAGELPAVGSECIFAGADFDLYNGLSVGDRVKIIYHDINNRTPVAVFKHWDDGSFDVAMGGSVNFTPIDNRTNKEKLIDELQADIKILKETVLNGGSEAEYLLRKYNITRKES